MPILPSQIPQSFVNLGAGSVLGIPYLFLIAVGMVAPKWLASIASADVLRIAKGGKPASDTVLVVCQFSGGNDGLNTVVPWANKLYYQFRPTIGIAEDKVIKLDDAVAIGWDASNSILVAEE